jgi:ornithine--oxo-acid transaminase
VALVRGKGLYVWDVEGKKYMDFLNGYSSTNQGHCHPKIVKALNTQSKLITNTSRAFYNEHLGATAEYLCNLLGYDKMLPMNGGVEAAETAVKLARRWGYVVKKIPENQAVVLMAKGNFWGRTITASGACDDPQRYTNFGPFTPGFDLVNYNDIEDLKQKLAHHGHNVCAVMIEPIQGEAGVIVPAAGYLKEVKKLCK